MPPTELSPDPALPTRDTTPAPHGDDLSGCPDERFDTLTAARTALLDRRTRAALSGSPHTIERRAYPCADCGGAHLIRVTTPDGAAA